MLKEIYGEPTLHVFETEEFYVPKKLDTYLTGSLMRYFAEYMSDYQLLCQCNKDGFTPYSEIAEIQKDVEYDIKRIDKRFSSTKCLQKYLVSRLQ